ncbi:MAG: molybdopterin molybdotransferase MoeA [Deltaproteobacteria bacterium]|nr:molybdopterin molybdotransferase MoeA [Deltaproteobacteria bacterium]
MLTVIEAQQRILGQIARMSPERVPLTEAVGRVLARRVVAKRPLPPFDNSAMDGYAVRGADLSTTGVTRLRLVGESRAGTLEPVRVGEGEAARVLTGAPMPPGTDTVAMQEHARVEGDCVVIERAPAFGSHVRHAGEDVECGATTLTEGAALGPGEVGLLAALGVPFVETYARPRVAILATGDELREVDEPLEHGQIVTSNSYALAAQVVEAGGVPVPLGIARDDEDDLVARIRRGMRSDLLITSGGVSVGDYDLVRKVLETLGWRSEFWKVAMRPGKPLAFGVLERVPVIGLPGNPASSMVTFELFVRPAIRAMAGHRRPFRPVVTGRLVTAYHKSDDRTHFVRCGASDQRGEIYLQLLDKQGSGMLSSMVGVSALAVIHGPRAEVPAGGLVPAILLDRTFADRELAGFGP